MSHFDYYDGALCAEGVPLSRIAETVGTPFYCYSSAAMVERYRRFQAALAALDAGIYYSVKANGNLAVIATFAREGAGADVVSEGELRRALAAGVPADRIVFSGVGKTRGELAFALERGIAQINVESKPELESLSALAAARRRDVAVAIRVNPEVDARTHEKITTGRKEHKFGVAWDRLPAVYARAAGLPGIRVVGLAVHIGSQLMDLDPFEAAFARVADLVTRLRDAGHRVTNLDLGGGLGIAYDGAAPPAPEAYVDVIGRTVGGLGCRLMIEPGRTLVGEAGVLVSTVIYVKQAEQRRFVVLDAAMNDLLRPALYGARHRIVSVSEPALDAAEELADFVGPVCETSDVFATDVRTPPLASGALVAFLSAGAYGAVMSSTYNARLLVPEVMVAGGQFAVIRPRPGYEDLLAQDRMPGWLEGGPQTRSEGVA